MSPALKPGCLVLFSVNLSNLKRGEVVIFLHEGLEKIKRVADIEPGKVFVLGDNSVSSTDSRHFGWVDKDQLKGRLVWPKL